jgi:DNA-binding transcriptional ArsR family regulator
MSNLSDVTQDASCAVHGVDADRVSQIQGRMPAEADVIDLADVFGLLAVPSRLRLLLALLEDELCVSELAAAAGMSESATSHALRLLRAHRVVTARRSGRMAYYSLADAHVRMLLDVALTHIEHSVLVHDRPSADGVRDGVEAAP